MADTVNSKIVIITGGASGIGLAMTRHFASQGHQVFIFDVDAKSGAAVAAEVTTAHPSAAVTFKRCDVTSWEDLCAAFGEVYLTAGRIDIVMANAGTVGKGVSQLVDEDELVKPSTEVLDINILGTIYCEHSMLRFSGLVHQGLIQYSRSRKNSNALSAKERARPYNRLSGVDHMHQFDRGAVSSPIGSDIRCIQVRCRRLGTFDGEASRAVWGTNQLPGAVCDKYEIIVKKLILVTINPEIVQRC